MMEMLLDGLLHLRELPTLLATMGRRLRLVAARRRLGALPAGFTSRIYNKRSAPTKTNSIKDIRREGRTEKGKHTLLNILRLS